MASSVNGVVARIRQAAKNLIMAVSDVGCVDGYWKVSFRAGIFNRESGHLCTESKLPFRDVVGIILVGLALVRRGWDLKGRTTQRLYGRAIDDTDTKAEDPKVRTFMEDTGNQGSHVEDDTIKI